MLVERVISGGQTGADMAALVCARRLGIATGGWMPRGFLTLAGPRPDLGAAFGMAEHRSARYPPRTRANIRDSDGTLRFAADWNTPGERCTARAILHYRKPSLDVDVRSPPEAGRVREWLKENGIRVLNVAGNTERAAPGIEEFVIGFLTEVLRGPEPPSA